MQLAIADAKLKAESIAKPLGVKITGVIKVYKTGRYDVDRDGVPDYLDSHSGAYDAPQTIFSKFEVEDKDVEEYITIVFEIGKG